VLAIVVAAPWPSMRRWLSSLAVALVSLSAARDATAVRKPDRRVERPVELAEGARGRLVRTVDSLAPPAAAARWKAFTDAHAGWAASWDVDTGVPVRLWGPGLAVPGANARASLAEAAARGLLDEQLALLGPGSVATDWQLASNVVHGRGALRTVAFIQRHAGLPVRGGAVSFLFKRDRLFVIGSDARPDVAVTTTAPVVDEPTARAAAVAWIASDYGATPTVRSSGPGLTIIPLLRDGAAVEYRVVTTVTVELVAPRARWDVFVDAATGKPVAREQLLRFGAGVLEYDVPIRQPSGTRQRVGAARAAITVGGTATTTDPSGGFGYLGPGPAAVIAAVTGPQVRVTSQGRPGATFALAIADGATGAWSAASNPAVDAQLTAFVHASRLKAFAKAELDPGLAWLDGQLEVGVNEVGSCDAFSTGDDIHFFAAGDGCENTGRLPDLIYHELGHSLHFHAIIEGAGQFDSAMSEGAADYLAASTVDDAALGRGYFTANNNPLRDLDPVGREAQWPRDLAEDPKTTGLILGGALWDLRKALVAELGAAAGKRTTDDLYYAVLQRASDIPSAYVELLAADDDDGDLTNGTPHKCAIDAAFTPHGLVDAQLGIGVELPVRVDGTVSVRVTAPAGGCAVADVGAMSLDWRLRGDAPLTAIAMTRTGATFSATIPPQPEGAVVEYRVIATLADGSAITYPNNPGDPLYQFYVGPLTPLYCTDFERDPFAAGWGHDAATGTDEWQWGAPHGSSSNGDPLVAASGASVVGQDLGTDGRYARNTSSRLVAPAVDTTGRTGVRLQLKRWLSVEDGFYDRARIVADGAVVWASYASPDQSASTPTLDREWRFVDVELDAQAADGSVQIRFELDSDVDQQYGGWTIDDFCIVARGTGPVVPVCGDGDVDDGEGCDDGNTLSADGCSSVCVVEVVDPDDDGGCCGAGRQPRGALVLGLGTALLVLRRRRRR